MYCVLYIVVFYISSVVSLLCENEYLWLLSIESAFDYNEADFSIESVYE